MTDFAQFLDVGDTLAIAPAPTVSLITAGSNSGTAVSGAGFDRIDPSTGALAESAAAVLAYSAVLAATKTLSLGGTITVNTSSDNSTWGSLASITGPGVVATGAGTLTGVSKINLGSLLQAKRYVQVVYTPTLSNTGTDTATITLLGVMGGFDRLAA